MRSKMATRILFAMASLGLVTGCGGSTPRAVECATEGATECRGDRIATCVLTAGRLAWGDPADCGEGLACVEGSCAAAACSDECEDESATRCDGDKVAVCDDPDGDGCLEWDEPVACPAGAACSGDRCPGGCVPTCDALGASACREGGLATCVDPGDGCLAWGGAVPCPGGGVCMSDHCEAPCVPECIGEGSTTCVPGGLSKCVDTGGGCLRLSEPVACEDGEACLSGDCRPPCDSECTIAGAKVCKGEAVATCTDGNGTGCLVWSDPDPCPAGETCSNGVCSEMCADACTSQGAVACEAGLVVTCLDDDQDGCLEWADATACGEGLVCSGGICSAECLDECTIVGATACKMDAVVECGDWDANGCREWGEPVPCGQGETCSGGFCGTACADECTVSGATKCTGNATASCGQYDADDCLEWGTPAACKEGLVCSSGQCAPSCASECPAEGVKACEGNAVVSCGDADADACLEWGTPATCPVGQVCSNGACGATCSAECTADGAKRCAGGSVQTCRDANVDGCLEWGTAVPCPGGTVCSSGECVLVCADGCGPEGSTRCDPGGVSSCGDVDGDACLEWSLPVACGAGMTCSNGTCSKVCEDECGSAGERACHDGGVTSCGTWDDDACLEWGTTVACGSDEVCANGTCLPVSLEKCASVGAVRCASGSSIVTCVDLDGGGTLGWGTAVDCPAGQACAVNACTAACDPCQGVAAEAAVPVAPGEAATATAAVQSVPAWFSFEVEKGRYYKASVRRTSGTGVALELLLSDATTVVDSLDIPATDRSHVALYATYDGLLYVRALPYVAEANVTFEMTVEDLGPNDHGIAPADATTLATDGAPVAGTIEIHKAKDWFRFDQTAGRYYRVTMSKLDTASQYAGTTLAIYADDGTTYVMADARSEFGVSLGEQAPASGTRYVQVGAYDSLASGTYTVKVEDLGPNDHGDEPYTATHVETDGNPVPGTFEVAGASDWFRFDTLDGVYYRVTVSALKTPSSATGMDLALYGTGGTALIDSDWSSASGVYLALQARVTGPIYVRVAARDPDVSGTYTVKVEDLGENDHGNGPSTATPVETDGVEVPGTIEVYKAKDWFQYEAVEGRYYRETVSKLTTSSSQTGMAITLYGGDGSVQLDSDWSQYSGVYLAQQSRTTGTVYLRAGAYDPWASGTYTVKVADLGENDHGNDAASATLVAPGGGPVPGKLEVYQAKDWFRFDTVSGRYYRVSVSKLATTSSETGVVVQLYAGDGSTFLQSDYSQYKGVSLAYGATANGPIYVRVGAYGKWADGTYTITVDDLGTEPPG